jgi:xylulose-5-phosphate/fructose-6-phosphate phosphoketolase
MDIPGSFTSSPIAHKPRNIHVRGYKEKGNINTPLELAIRNQVDRFQPGHRCDRPRARLQGAGAHLKEWLKGQIIESINYAYSEGIDKPEIRNWTMWNSPRGWINTSASRNS